MCDIIFDRQWAMPNGKTFTIKPIRELVEVEVYNCVGMGGGSS